MTDNELTLTYIDGLMRGREEAAEQLAAAQARGRQLHVRLDAVLEFMDPRNHQTHCECDPSVGYQCAACSWPTLPEIAPAYALLSMRTNEDALRERLRAEREQIASHFEKGNGAHPMWSGIAHAIRNLGDEQ